MKERLLFRKTCSIHASDLHFATVIFPFITKELANNTTVKTILERNEEENIEKITENIGLNSEIKEKIKEIDWKESDITKIREIFKSLEEDIANEKNIDIIVLGSNLFIQKINKAIDLWVKNNMEKIQGKNVILNIINCFSFEQSKKIGEIMDWHDYILKTSGMEEILGNQELLKAN